MLANIYLHELDLFVEQQKQKFDQPHPNVKVTPEYSRLCSKAARLRKKADKVDEPQKTAVLAELHDIRAKQLSTPCKSQTDKKIKYVRYADDFLIGVVGSKEDCERIKSELKTFICDTLKMELSEEKTLITHSQKKARFLGYDVCVRRTGQIKQDGRGSTRRTLNNMVELTVPFKDKIERFLFDKGVVKQINGKLKFTHRPELLQITEFEIVSSYNAELRGICNFYRMASNFNSLDYFAYLMEYSCLKTLAGKRKSTIAKIIHSHQDGYGKWCIPYKTAKGEKRLYFAKFSDCKKGSAFSDHIRNDAIFFSKSINTFEARLKAKICELCGTVEAKHYEIHHVKRLKDLKGKALWEKYMIARNRKTLVVCRECHKNIHNN